MLPMVSLRDIVWLSVAIEKERIAQMKTAADFNKEEEEKKKKQEEEAKAKSQVEKQPVVRLR